MNYKDEPFAWVNHKARRASKDYNIITLELLGIGERMLGRNNEEKVVEHQKRSGNYGAEMAGNKTSDTEDFWN